MRPSTCVVMPRWDLKLALSLIPKYVTVVFVLVTHHGPADRYRVSLLPTIPSIIHQLAHSPLFEQTDLSSLDSIGSGAAYLPPTLAQKFMQKVSANVIFSEGQSLLTLSVHDIHQQDRLDRLWDVGSRTHL